MISAYVWTDGSGPSEQGGAKKGETAVGIGGWGVVLKLPGSMFTHELSGAEYDATSARMEIMAVIQALDFFDEPAEITVFADASYVVNAFHRDWFKNWQRNGWMNSRGGKVANRDLWERLLAAVERHHSVSFVKVKGHSKDPNNERADRLAHHAKHSVMSIA